jgi:hypothetical protein
MIIRTEQQKRTEECAADETYEVLLRHAATHRGSSLSSCSVAAVAAETSEASITAPLFSTKGMSMRVGMIKGQGVLIFVAMQRPVERDCVLLLLWVFFFSRPLFLRIYLIRDF